MLFKTKSIFFTFILFFSFVSSNLYANNPDALSNKIIGTWETEENIAIVKIISRITFNKDNSFVHIQEETTGETKASAVSEGIYTIKDSVLTLDYKTSGGKKFTDKDRQKNSFSVYIIDNMLGYPAYKFEDKNNIKKFTTSLSSFTVNSAYGFEVSETIKESVTLKPDNTVVLIDMVTRKNLKSAAHNKKVENSSDEEIKKTGTYTKDKNGHYTFKFTKSTADIITSPENPEIRNLKVFNDGDNAVINPYKRVK